MVDKVRTQKGVKKYGLPIGSPITAKMAKAAVSKAGRGSSGIKARIGGLEQRRSTNARMARKIGAARLNKRGYAPDDNEEKVRAGLGVNSSKVKRVVPKPPKEVLAARIEKARRGKEYSITEAKHREKNPYKPIKKTGGTPTGPEPLSNDEYTAHTAMVEQKVGEAIKAGKTTDKMYGKEDDKGNIIWDKEREKLHRELADEVWKKQRADSVPNEGKALLAGGLGGAGKSTTLAKHADVDQSQYVTVNPDDVKEIMAEKGLMPKIEGLSPMEASALVHEESSHIAMMVAQRAYAEKKNIIWDITMSSGGSVGKRLDQLEANGYNQIDAVFVDIPVETSVQRALSRHRRGMEDYRNGKGDGGRYVPPSIIRQNKSDTHSSKNREVFESLQKRFTSYGIWDNSGKAPEKVEGTGRWG